MRSAGSGLDTVWTHNPQDEVRELPNGTLVKVNEVRHSYNLTEFDIEVLAGNLPSTKEVLKSFGAYELFGGRVVSRGGKLYTISVNGSD